MTIPVPVSSLSPADEAWRGEVAEFARRSVAPRVRSMDEQARLDPALRTELFGAGLMGVQIPQNYGGGGKDLFAVMLAIEELAAVDPAVAVFVDVQNALVIHALLRHGDGNQKRQHLPALATGTVGAFALSEEGSGSDAFALSTVARRDGERFLLSGRKMFTTSAAEAGLFLVMARIPDTGITAFLVPRDAPGLSVGDPVAKLGIRASSTCELVLDEVPVGRRDVLGKEGMGELIAIRSLEIGKLGIAAQLVGLAGGAMRHAARYAQQREQFGGPIAAFQGVQFPLAKVAAKLTAARVLLYDTTRLAQIEPESPRLSAAAAMVKYLASEVAEEAASLAVEVFGGLGFTTAAPVEKLYRDAKVGKIYEGTTNIQLRTIAARLLRDTDPAAVRESGPVVVRESGPVAVAAGVGELG